MINFLFGVCIGSFFTAAWFSILLQVEEKDKKIRQLRQELRGKK